MDDTTPGPTPSDLALIAKLVYGQSGIRLTGMKSALVSARLQKVLRKRGFKSFAAYLKQVSRDDTGTEIVGLVDALTTNYTSFFREPDHFRVLSERIIPEVLARGRTSIVGWSAGCATGEEVFSILVTLLDALIGRSQVQMQLTGMDVSTTALAVARRGVYGMDSVRNVPYATLRRYFERGVGTEEGLVRVRSSVRRLVSFGSWSVLEPLRAEPPCDFIFCRNVLMYFDNPARQRAITNLESRLAPGGYLFVSHAESLTAVEHELVRVASAVYQRRAA